MLQVTALRWFVLLSGIAAVAALYVAFMQGDGMFAGSRPSDLGVRAGRLAPPKATPNCVSSQADAADAEHYVAPIGFTGSAAEAIAALSRIVERSARARVVQRSPDYLYAEFTSRWMGFVDDVEFYASVKDGVIHVRSASRLGRTDFGVNRARIESIRAQFAAAPRP